MLFKSAVDWWYYLIIIVVAIFLVTVLWPLIDTGELSIHWAAIIILLSLCLPIWLYSTNYRVTADELLIKSGPFKWVILLSDIQSVEPTRSALSSPALSLNRLRIKYSKDKQILISPDKPEEFLNIIGHSK